jgi:hydrogenase/urease accessory protein HupE
VLKILLLLLPLFLYAHQSGLSYIKLVEDSNKNIHITYKKPLSDLYANKITINYPSYCITTAKDPQEIDNGYIINRSTMRCGNKGLEDARIWIDGLLRQDKGVLVEYDKDGFSKKVLLRSNRPFIHLNQKNSTFKLFIAYVELGIHHILSGYDHLLFVLCLLVLAKDLRSLLLAVTSFTLAHSITLASAMLGLVNMPVAFIESMIALSIIFLARELIEKDTMTLTKSHLEYIAFIFGLLHGFGFSNVLKSIGLVKGALALSLFSFNLGIEIGQIMFIVSVSLIYWILKKIFHTQILNNTTLLGYFVGTVASFWFIERVLAF